MLACCGEVLAQSNFGSTTTNGLFGQNTVGGGASTQAPSGSRGAGGGGSSGSGIGSTQNAALANPTAAAAVETQQVRGAFVGADRNDTTNALSRQSATARTTTDRGLQNIFQQFSQGNFNALQRNQQSRTQPNIRVSLQMGFQPPPVSPARIEAFNQRLVTLPGIRFVGPATVTLEGRTAVLRGMVATAEDRELAEALAMMEPDVRDVRNELEVDPSAARAEELPPASATP
jgi:hypothetical protein